MSFQPTEGIENKRRFQKAMGAPHGVRINANSIPNRCVPLAGCRLEITLTKPASQRLSYAPSAAAPPLAEIPLTEIVGVIVLKSRFCPSPPLQVCMRRLIFNWLQLSMREEISSQISRRSQSRPTEPPTEPQLDSTCRQHLIWRTSCRKFTAEYEAADAYPLELYEFALFTAKKGLFRGRVFVFKEEAEHTRQKWIETMRRVIAGYDQDELLPASTLDIARRTCLWHYSANSTQIFIANLIVANFVCHMAQAQIPGT
jgi:hypothetical protein